MIYHPQGAYTLETALSEHLEDRKVQVIHFEGMVSAFGCMMAHWFHKPFVFFLYVLAMHHYPY